MYHRVYLLALISLGLGGSSNSMADIEYHPQWSNPLPTGAIVHDLDFSPVTDIGYAVCDDGSVLTSTDDGASWTILSQLGENLGGVAALASGDIVVAAQYSGGPPPGEPFSYLISSDGGTTWTAGTGSWLRRVHGLIEVSPGLLSLVGDDGLHFSTDGGITWARQSQAPAPLHAQAWIDDQNATMANGDTSFGGLWRTIDGGVTWTETLDRPMQSVSFDAAGIEGIAGPTEVTGIIHVTSDGGASWVPSGPQFALSASLSMGSGQFIGASATEQMSVGGIWKLTSGVIALDDALKASRCAAVHHMDRAPDGGLVACGAAGSLLRSTDSGETWTDVGSIFPDAERPAITGMVVADDYAYGLAVGGGDLGGGEWTPQTYHLFGSTDDGASWSLLTLPIPEVRAWGARNTGYIFVCDENGGSRSSDEGQTWSALETLPVIYFSLVDLPPSGVAIYGTWGGDIYRSEEGSTTWELRTGGLPSVTWRGIDFLTDDVGFVISDDHDVWRTNDGGASWSVVGTLPDPSPPFRLSRVATMRWISTSVGLVALSRGSDQDFSSAGLLRTTDGGATWVYVAGSGYLNLDIGPDGHIYALVHPRDDDVVRASEDDGATWVDVPHGIEIYADFLLEPIVWGPTTVAAKAEGFLVAGTVGEILIHERVVVAVDDDMSSPSVDTRLGVSRPVGAMFTFEAVLASPGEARLEVVDVQGRRVSVLADQHLPAGATSFTWDGTASSGYGAASGVYFVRLRTRDVIAVQRVLLVR